MDNGKKQHRFPPGTTLEQAKEWLRQRYDKGKGATCPCCNQSVKLYPDINGIRIAFAVDAELFLQDGIQPKDLCFKRVCLGIGGVEIGTVVHATLHEKEPDKLILDMVVDRDQVPKEWIGAFGLEEDEQEQ